MNSQKAENILNLALDTPESERERSSDLNVGFDVVTKSWELIVRYNGSLDAIANAYPQIQVYELLNGYAILIVPELLVDQIVARPEIEYVEKPKQLFFAVNQGKAASCINPLQFGSQDLSGRGVIVAIIDSGIDYRNADFRTALGETRILELWDQVTDQVYTREQLNGFLQPASGASDMEEDRDAVSLPPPSLDLSGHGTAVAGIAAGNGLADQGKYRGIAYESELVVVKLGNSVGDSFPRTTQLMRALNFVVQSALRHQMPVAVNLSFGNTYGSHDGTSLLETYISSISDVWKSVIVVGTGNEGSGAGHARGVLSMGETARVELSVAPYETGFSLQLWKGYEDVFDVSIVSPGGVRVGPLGRNLGPVRISLEDTMLLMYYGKPSPYSIAQEIFMDFIPQGNQDYVGSGIWRFELTPMKIVSGQYDMWLPVSGVLNRSTRFLQPNPDTTLTIPSTAAKVISVGAYDDSFRSYADFSGRGFTRMTNQIKPDLCAPGVNIITTRAGGGYEPVTGTSFAAPFVTGGAALLMEWGIVRGNDPYLYGEKMKAYMIRGATQLPGYNQWPNPLLGYGALCVRDSLP